MQNNLFDRIRAFTEKGCSLFVILLVTMPLWVISLALRGRIFAITALAVLLLVLVGFSLLYRLFNRD